MFELLKMEQLTITILLISMIRLFIQIFKGFFVIIGHPEGGGDLLNDGTIIDEDKGFCKSIINDDMTWHPFIQLPFEFEE